MPKYDPQMENRITDAIQFISENPRSKVAKVARQFTVTASLLRARLQGRPDQRAKGGHNQALDATQDKALKSFASFLIYIGQPPGKQTLRQGANSILRAAGSARSVSKNWATQWLTRNKPYFHTLRAKTLAAERKYTHIKEDFERHFEEFREVCVEYGIAEEDIWNFNESGFRIGCLAGRVVITHATTKSVYLADPEERESITAIEAINGTGCMIPAMLILSGCVMLEKHFENDLPDGTLLGITKTGYTNQFLTLDWLYHWNKHTEKNKKGKYRMLIFDGHGSHLSNDFLFFCWDHDIIPFLLPSYTTHLLQPLDVGIFQPLKHWYQVALHESIQYGNLEFSKLDFLNAYQTMRRRIFKVNTIKSAWQKTGLIPFKPDVVYEHLKKWEPEPALEPEPPTTPIRRYCMEEDLAHRDPTYKPFQHTPNTANREAHRIYLSMRLSDHFSDIQPITPSYHKAMVVYNRSITQSCLKAKLIEECELNRIEQEKEKAKLKAVSGRYVQKNGVILMGTARSQIMECNEAEEAYRESVKNTKLGAIIKKATLQWKRVLKELPKKWKEWEIYIEYWEYIPEEE